MSNVKDISIVAHVPYDWAAELPESEAACFASLVLNPVIGVEVHQRPAGYVDNEHGGRTSMYDVMLFGSEALAYPFLERLVAAFASVGTVTEAKARDLEEPGCEWEQIRRPTD